MASSGDDVESAAARKRRLLAERRRQRILGGGENRMNLILSGSGSLSDPSSTSNTASSIATSKSELVHSKEDLTDVSSEGLPSSSLEKKSSQAKEFQVKVRESDEGSTSSSFPSQPNEEEDNSRKLSHLPFRPSEIDTEADEKIPSALPMNDNGKDMDGAPSQSRQYIDMWVVTTTLIALCWTFITVPHELGCDAIRGAIQVIAMGIGTSGLGLFVLLLTMDKFAADTPDAHVTWNTMKGIGQATITYLVLFLTIWKAMDVNHSLQITPSL